MSSLWDAEGGWGPMVPQNDIPWWVASLVVAAWIAFLFWFLT